MYVVSTLISSESDGRGGDSRGIEKIKVTRTDNLYFFCRKRAARHMFIMPFRLTSATCSPCRTCMPCFCRRLFRCRRNWFWLCFLPYSTPPYQAEISIGNFPLIIHGRFYVEILCCGLTFYARANILKSKLTNRPHICYY